MMQYFKEYQATVMNVSWQYQEILGDIGNISWHPDLLCRGYFFILAMNPQQANRQLDIFFTAHLSRQGSLSTSLWWFVYIYIYIMYICVYYISMVWGCPRRLIEPPQDPVSQLREKPCRFCVLILDSWHSIDRTVQNHVWFLYSNRMD